MTTTSGMKARAATGTDPVVVTQGFWAYAVRPPMWPIGNTPSERGGVRLATTATEVHVVLVAEASVDRIFFLGGRDTTGASVACTLTVESIDSPGTPAKTADITKGMYVERLRNPLSSTPTALTPLRYDTLPATDPISVFLASIQPGQSGSGGIGGGATG